MRTRGLPAVVTVLVVVVIAALAICVVFGPGWIVGERPGLTAAQRLTAQNDVRSTLLQGFGGFLALGGVALGAVMTLRQVRANRDGHSIELFTKAIDMLASKEESVRHGGVYALERLAELDERYHGHAHALLTAFIRRRVPWPPADADADPRSQPLHGGTYDDVGAALAALSRQAAVFDGWSELERVDLRGADLTMLRLSRVCFAYANLDGASLVEARLVSATLSGTSLRAANLTGADLDGADLSDADLTGADLSGAILTGADLTGARLDRAGLDGVVVDSTTTWPAGFTPPRERRNTV